MNNDPGILQRLMDSNSTATTTAESVAVVVECLRLSDLCSEELITIVVLQMQGFHGWSARRRRKWLRRFADRMDDHPEFVAEANRAWSNVRSRVRGSMH